MFKRLRQVSRPENLELFPEDPCRTSFDPFFHENRSRDSGYGLIAGVDEAGRGPLAGPVVAAAVIIPEGVRLSGIRDSKKMTARARLEAFHVIMGQALTFGIGVVSVAYIEKFNILNASLEAMLRAIHALDPQPEMILVDGIHAVATPIKQECLKKGDQISRSISAASVLAKVYRDRIMLSYHNMYPDYGFDKHKGYGTRRHLEVFEESMAHVRFTGGHFGGCCRLTRERLELGQRGEALALEEIKRLGYRKIIKNYRCRLGEVDLVAKDGDVLVFIEIKTRKGSAPGLCKRSRNLKKTKAAFQSGIELHESQ